MRDTKALDIGSIITIAITLVLFVTALFLKGLSHDILLEAGVFLVSAKLVLMGHKNVIMAEDFHAELQHIRKILEKWEGVKEKGSMG